MLVVSVSPIIAPTAGGYITAALGWRWVFVVLIVIVSVILAGTYFYLPESKQPDPSFSLKPLPILRNFQSVLKNPHFLTFALTGAISYAGLYAYIGGAPHIFMEIFKVTEAQFGWIFAIIAMGLIGASQANNLALAKYRSEQIIRVASFSQCIIGVALLCITLSGFSNLYLTVFMIFIFLACQGFIFPNSTALALAPLGHNAGNASALIGAIQMTIGASASALVGVFQNRSALPMPLIMTACSITAFIVFISGRKLLIGRVEKELVQGQDIEMLETL
jgi:DHA1 family bicyclomycin/chloramphenicol resistance-like MFS transporter